MQNEYHNYRFVANKARDVYCKTRKWDAHDNISVSVPRHKLLKFANTNAIFKLKPLPDGYN